MRFLFGLLSILFIGCQANDVSSVGKYITKINKNTVIFEDGSNLELENCESCKTIYLIRHAEKDTLPAKNPILTEEGYQRSYTLAKIFKSTRLDAVYSTLYNRTIHTVDSLTSMKGIGTQIYQPKDIKNLSNALLTKNNMNYTLISGHSNTTPGFASALMGKKQFEQGFEESDYDNLLIVNMDEKGEKKLYKLKYKN